MGKRSRDKGKRGEREAAEFLRAHGIDARRILGQERDGGDDLETALGRVEVKFRKSVPVTVYRWLEEGGARFLMMRRDGRKWLFVIDGEEFFRLLAGGTGRGDDDART